VKECLLKGIEYNSSTKGKDENTNKIVTTTSTENFESEKWDTEVDKDKKYLSTMWPMRAESKIKFKIIKTRVNARLSF